MLAPCDSLRQKIYILSLTGDNYPICKHWTSPDVRQSFIITRKGGYCVVCVRTSSLPKRWLFNQAASCHVYIRRYAHIMKYILPCYRCVIHECIYYPVTDALSTSVYITMLSMRYPRVYILPCYLCVIHEYIYYPVTDALSASVYITLLPMCYPRVYILPCYRCVIHECIYYPVTDVLSTSV